MGRQKVVIRVPMKDAKKRMKALKIAAGFSGVIQAGIEGVDKDRVVVVGEGIDSVELTMTLRKKMGSGELIFVTSLNGKKDEYGEKDEYGYGKKGEYGKKDEYGYGKGKIAWPSHAAYSQYPYYTYPTQDPPPSCAIS